jgi:hypothetical protein
MYQFVRKIKKYSCHKILICCLYSNYDSVSRLTAVNLPVLIENPEILKCRWRVPDIPRSIRARKIMKFGFPDNELPFLGFKVPVRLLLVFDRADYSLF